MKSLLFPLTIVFLFAGCQESVFQSLKKKVDDLFVYEGSLIPVVKILLSRKERKRDSVTQIDGHWFYDAKVKVTGDAGPDDELAFRRT